MLVVGLFLVANQPLGASGAYVQTMKVVRKETDAVRWRVWYLGGIFLGGLLATLLGTGVRWGRLPSDDVNLADTSRCRCRPFRSSRDGLRRPDGRRMHVGSWHLWHRTTLSGKLGHNGHVYASGAWLALVAIIGLFIGLQLRDRHTSNSAVGDGEHRDIRPSPVVVGSR